MRITTVKKSPVGSVNTLDTLVHQVYAVDVNTGPAEFEAAKKALLTANPHLSGVVKIPVGTVIRVPDLPPGKIKPRADDSGYSAGEALASKLFSALRATADRYQQDAEAQVEEAKTTVALLKDRNIINALAENKDAVLQSENIGKQAELLLKNPDDLMKTRAEFFNTVEKELTISFRELGIDKA